MVGRQKYDHTYFRNVLKPFNVAECLITEVEDCQSDIPLPAINELRCAGHQLLKLD